MKYLLIIINFLNLFENMKNCLAFGTQIKNKIFLKNSENVNLGYICSNKGSSQKIRLFV